MIDAAQIANRYIAVWNETDPARRRALLAEGWTENATYVDPLMAGEGHDEVGALIAAVHERRLRRRRRWPLEVDNRIPRQGSQRRLSRAPHPTSPHSTPKDG
jgi:hypothetical protein